jgi:hypothetical protein
MCRYSTQCFGTPYNVSILYAIFQYSTQCVVTLRNVSVLYIMCRYSTQCFVTPHNVSVLHNMCQNCPTPWDTVLFVPIAHLQSLLQCSRSVGLLYIAAFFACTSDRTFVKVLRISLCVVPKHKCIIFLKRFL